MEKKKLFMSVTATAVIASSLVHAQEVNASSYTVKQGDSLWSISQLYDTSVAQIKSLNNLSTDLIRPNQVLKVANDKNNSSSSSSSSNNSSSSSNKSNTNKPSTYTVKQGDNLSKIAAAHKISLANLMKWNNLDTTLIFPGDKLKVSATSNSGNSSSSNNSGNNSSAASSSSANNTATTYIVKSGDNLSKIAAAHGISLNNLKKWNNLSSDLIHPGDRLTVKSGDNSSSSTSNSNSTGKQEEQTNNSSNGSSSGNPTNSTAKTYTVKSGDNLSRIAATHGISLNNLKKWNNLTSHIIFPGDRLIVSEDSTSSNGAVTSKPDNTNSNSQVGSLIDVAKSVLGIKYTWAGASPSTGFDCSGFIYWAFKENGQDIGRHSTDGYYNRSYIVNKPEVGDLVFFENTYRSGISHMGIYLGNNEFIHAGSSTGVTVANVNNSYWQKHFHSFKRFY